MTEANTVVLMQGIDEKLAAVDSESRSAIKSFLTALQSNSRPEGCIRMEGTGGPMETYRMQVADYWLIWAMGPSIAGKVLVMQIGN